MGGQRVYQNVSIPEEFLSDENFLMEFKSKFSYVVMSDDSSPKDLRRLLRAYNEASLDEREAMNEVFVWATGYSLPNIAAKVALSGQPANMRRDQDVDNLILGWGAEGVR